MKWKAIAVCGIWIGIGLAGISGSESVVGVAICAIFATYFVAQM